VRGITRDTVVELVDRKILWLFGVVTGVMLLIVYASGNIHTTFSGPSGTEEFDMSALDSRMLAMALDGMVSFLLFLTVLATTGLIPKMLEKGRADFYLSKPNSRSRLLLGKLAAMWVVYGGLMVACGVLVFLAFALAHQTFQASLLYLFAMNMLLLFIWLSIVAVAGVLFNSTVLTIMATFVIWVLQSLLSHHDQFAVFIKSRIVVGLLDGLYYVIPKHGRIGDIALDLATGTPVADWMPLWSSLLFGLAMMYLAVIAFQRRNY